MFYSALNKIDNSPYSLWNSKLVNEEFAKLASAITGISSKLMNTLTAQVINGQKTFADLYFDSEKPTYDSIMSWLNHDISPIAGQGLPTLSRNGTILEGKFTKPNVSGVVMDAALKNPIFSMNNVSIQLDLNNRTTPNVVINVPNAPMAAYDAQKLGSKPSIGLNNIQPFYWVTSQGFTGTFNFNTGGQCSTGTNVFKTPSQVLNTTTPYTYNFILGYNEAQDSTDLLVATNEAMSLIPTNYTSMIPLYSTYCTIAPCTASTTTVPTADINFQNGISLIREDKNQSLFRPYPLLDEYKTYFPQIGIAKLRVTNGVEVKISSQSLIPPGNCAPGEVSTVAQAEPYYEIYVPMIMDNSTFLPISYKGPVTYLAIPKDSVYVTKVNTGKYWI